MQSTLLLLLFLLLLLDNIILLLYIDNINIIFITANSFECRHVFLFFFISICFWYWWCCCWFGWPTLSFSLFLFFMVPPSAFFCKAVCTRVLCVSSNICASDLLMKDGLFYEVFDCLAVYKTLEWTRRWLGHLVGHLMEVMKHRVRACHP